MALKVTIEELDIKGAIETYVRGMIPGLGEDTVVEIDISATRGPAGMTANINLLFPADIERLEAEEAAKAKPATKQTRAPRSVPVGKAPAAVAAATTAPSKGLGIKAKVEEAKAEVATKPSPEKEPEPEAKYEEAQVVEEPDYSILADGPQEGTEEAFAAEAAAEAAVEEEVAEEVAESIPAADPAPEVEAAPRKSLFSGLSKPVNT